MSKYSERLGLLVEAAMVRVQSQEIEQMAQWYRQWFGSSGG